MSDRHAALQAASGAAPRCCTKRSGSVPTLPIKSQPKTQLDESLTSSCARPRAACTTVPRQGGYFPQGGTRTVSAASIRLWRTDPSTRYHPFSVL